MEDDFYVAVPRDVYVVLGVLVFGRTDDLCVYAAHTQGRMECRFQREFFARSSLPFRDVRSMTQLANAQGGRGGFPGSCRLCRRCVCILLFLGVSLCGP